MSLLCWVMVMSPAVMVVEGAGLLSWQSLWESEDTDSNSKNGKVEDLLSMGEISEMRVRDIKRRLSRTHGYGADELSRMLDKRELIESLSYEEHKVEQKRFAKRKRIRMKRSIIVALICVLLVILRPLLVHVWEVAAVNLVVYTDKKRYEFTKCFMEYRSIKACAGLMCLIIVDLLKAWLTVSVMASWILSSGSPYRQKYLFPMPNIPVRPAEMIAAASGNAGKAGPLGSYGINVGPMVVTWFLRFMHGRIEAWMGKVLAKAHQKQRKEVRRHAKRKEKEAAKQQAEADRLVRKSARRARREARAAAAAENNNNPTNPTKTEDTATPTTSSTPPPPSYATET